jgi:ketosteroid isomerase-like protein
MRARPGPRSRPPGRDPNVSSKSAAEVIRAALAAMNAGDFEAAAEFIDDDVIWHYIGGTEPIRGKAGMVAMAGDREFTITTKLHDILVSDDHAVALVEATATRGDRTLHYRTAEVCHMRDGKLVERWAFSDDTAAIVDFFA